MQSVLNTLRVLEEVASRQPIGVGQLARVLQMPKSSVQRALVALHTGGWIRPASGEVTRWVMTTRALAVGGRVGSADVWRKRNVPGPLQHFEYIARRVQLHGALAEFAAPPKPARSTFSTVLIHISKIRYFNY